jgi:tRNA (guanine26-N2/guanine27-N2)-dimethyltransferase
MQAWEKLHPAKKDRFANDSPAKAIFEKTHGDLTVDFNSHPNANPQSRRIGLSRFQENPTAFWGPGTRSQSR